MSVTGQKTRIEESAGLIALDDLVEPSLRELRAYWDAKRGERDMPGRSDIDPIEMPRLLPLIFMVRLAREPLEFTYSLVGGENAEAHGQNFTGWKVHDLDSLWPGYGMWMHDFYAYVVRRGKPRAASGVMSFLDRGFYEFEAVYLPLAAADGEISHIMGGAVYRMVRGGG